jgi:predicted nucleotidyltransferase
MARVLCYNEAQEAHMSQEKLEQLLKDLKSGLAALYGSRLCGVYLFGSYARGEQDAESDLDILILLSAYDRYSMEIERTGELVSVLSLNYGVSISRKFIKESSWQTASSALLRNMRADAIPI